MINFYTCKDINETEKYWLNLGLTLYMRQQNCIILDSGEGQIGFLESKEHKTPVYSCISFTKDSREDIDELYNEVKELVKNNMRTELIGIVETNDFSYIYIIYQAAHGYKGAMYDLKKQKYKTSIL